MKYILMLVLLTGMLVAQDSTSKVEQEQTVLQERYTVVVNAIRIKTNELSELQIEKLNIEYAFNLLNKIVAEEGEEDKEEE